MSEEEEEEKEEEEVEEGASTGAAADSTAGCVGDASSFADSASIAIVAAATISSGTSIRPLLLRRLAARELKRAYISAVGESSARGLEEEAREEEEEVGESNFEAEDDAGEAATVLFDVTIGMIDAKVELDLLPLRRLAVTCG